MLSSCRTLIIFIIPFMGSTLLSGCIYAPPPSNPQTRYYIPQQSGAPQKPAQSQYYYTQPVPAAPSRTYSNPYAVQQPATTYYYPYYESDRYYVPPTSIYNVDTNNGVSGGLSSGKQ